MKPYYQHAGITIAGGLHWLSHWLGWNPCELVRIEHGYYRHTRTKCEGGCIGFGQQCEWKAIIKCRVCHKEQVVG